jgi:hypothetical protein
VSLVWKLGSELLCRKLVAQNFPETGRRAWNNVLELVRGVIHSIPQGFNKLAKRIGARDVRWRAYVCHKERYAREQTVIG